MGFLTFICSVVLLGYLFRWGFRLWLGWKLKKLQQQMSGNGSNGTYSRRNGNAGQREKYAREGDVKVEKGNSPGKKIRDRIGDYVDFEEVE
ncbi:DUF4834 family protein [Alistipes sp. OttesenSCG-928-L06]|nr:DUF4834 family protein [Alistipes sp. OttesenSCG-928-L06]